MANPLTIWAQGIPKAQGSMIATAGGKMRHATKGLTAWRETIGWCAKATLSKAKTSLYAKPAALSLRLEFYLPAQKASQPLYHTRTPDLDKLVRAVLDSLTGVLYEDDSQVVILHASKYWAGQEAYPGQPGVMIQATDLK